MTEGRRNYLRRPLLLCLGINPRQSRPALGRARPNGNWQTRWTNQYAVPSGKTQCGTRIKEMQTQAQVYSDADTGYALDLAQKYCSRFI